MDASSSRFAWPFPGLLIVVATMPVVMAVAGGRRRHLVDHLPATPPSAGTKDSSGGISSSDHTARNVALLVLSFLIALYVCCYIRYKFCRGEEQEQAAGRDDGRRRRPRNGGEGPRRRPAVELPQEPVLECTFWTADGWEQTLCSVCQSEMADGEKVRVLTACTHSFHATCVEQWLREHATCPLCRTPASAAAAKGRRHRPTT